MFKRNSENMAIGEHIMKLNRRCRRDLRGNSADYKLLLKGYKVLIEACLKRLPLFDLNKQFKTCRFRFNVHGKYRLIAIVDVKTFTV